MDASLACRITSQPMRTIILFRTTRRQHAAALCFGIAKCPVRTLRIVLTGELTETRFWVTYLLFSTVGSLPTSGAWDRNASAGIFVTEEVSTTFFVFFASQKGWLHTERCPPITQHRRRAIDMLLARCYTHTCCRIAGLPFGAIFAFFAGGDTAIAFTARQAIETGSTRIT
jgi:hypothetical protein